MSLVPTASPSIPPIAAKLCLALLASAAMLQAGCGMVSNLMHAAGVDMIPAEFKGLADTNLAVVTVTDSSQYTDDATARELSRRVGEVLTKKVKGVTLIREDQVEQWRDVNGWDAIDFASIGKGIHAEKVLGIELTDLRLHDGPTLYRGRADVVITVIDVATGKPEYTRRLDEYTFPTVAGQYTSETTETRFRKLYLSMLAQEIGRSFHSYDMTDRYAIDSAIASQ